MASTKIIDFYDDISKQIFYKISKNYETPNYVKQASLETVADVEALPLEYFADMARLKFPCHTKSATWLSGAYLLENYDAYQPQEREFITDRLIKSAKKFNIETDLADLFSKKADIVERNDDFRYALVTQDEGKTVKCFPTHTKESVAKSASTLLNNKFRYTFEMRKQASRNLLAAADSKGAILPQETAEYLTKSAGYGISLGTDIKNGILERVYMVKNSNSNPSCIALAKIGMALSESHIDIPTLDKLAHAIEEFDKLHKLTRNYGHIKTPEEICFALSQEKLSSYREGHIELKDGSIIPTSAVTDIDINDLKAVMGEKIASAFAPGGVYDSEEIEMILPSLPLDEIKVFKTLLRA